MAKGDLHYTVEFTITGTNLDVISFIDDLNKCSKRLAKKHNVSCPGSFNDQFNEV
jgi:hypothetical protein